MGRWDKRQLRSACVLRDASQLVIQFKLLGGWEALCDFVNASTAYGQSMAYILSVL